MTCFGRFYQLSVLVLVSGPAVDKFKILGVLEMFGDRCLSSIVGSSVIMMYMYVIYCVVTYIILCNNHEMK